MSFQFMGVNDFRWNALLKEKEKEKERIKIHQNMNKLQMLFQVDTKLLTSRAHLINVGNIASMFVHIMPYNINKTKKEKQ